MSARQAAVISLCAAGLAAVWWLDATWPQAGAWALIGLSLSVGFLHGALDAPLLQRKFANRWGLLRVLAAYLAAVLLSGWWLSGSIALALGFLIAMSVWHFGEAYGRWDDLPPWSAGLSRVVVGGAPIMLPIWLGPDTLAAVLAAIVEPAALQVWRATAMAWLVLLVAWILACGLPRPRAARHAWLELVGCAAAFTVFSPVMAFALYFGVYHAPTHIWRVWRAWTTSDAASSAKPQPALIAAGLLATLLATWSLGAGLWWLLSPDVPAAADSSSALHWLIVALAAVTAPHLVLIGTCSDFLSRNHRLA